MKGACFPYGTEFESVNTCEGRCYSLFSEGFIFLLLPKLHHCSMMLLEKEDQRDTERNREHSTELASRWWGLDPGADSAHPHASPRGCFLKSFLSVLQRGWGGGRDQSSICYTWPQTLDSGPHACQLSTSLGAASQLARGYS